VRNALQIGTMSMLLSPPASMGGLRQRDAFITSCVMQKATNDAILTNCLASICSLLLTTRPKALVVALDTVARDRVGTQLEQYHGVTVVTLPGSIDVARIHRNLSALPAPTRRRDLPIETYAAHRFELWKLTSWRKLLYFDATDVLFLRNASAVLADSKPFSAIVRRGQCTPHAGTMPSKVEQGLYDYINAGVMAFKPSIAAAEWLYTHYFSGDFIYCGGSDRSFGNQDVIRHAALETDVLGSFHEMSPCHNYRGWSSQRHCIKENLALLHGRSLWPTHISLPHRKVPTTELSKRLLNGQCSA
jgi:hypothetical protein